MKYPLTRNQDLAVAGVICIGLLFWWYRAEQKVKEAEANLASAKAANAGATR